MRPSFLEDGRMATGGEDGRIAIWQPGQDKPATVLQGIPLRSSASPFPPTAGCLPPPAGTPRHACGRSPAAPRACWTAIGRTSTALPSCPTVVPWSRAGYDLTLRIWPLAGGSPGHRHAAGPAQFRCRCARWRDRRCRRHGQGLFPVARRRDEGRGRCRRRADHRARGVGRRQARRRLQRSRRGCRHRPGRPQA